MRFRVEARRGDHGAPCSDEHSRRRVPRVGYYQNRAQSSPHLSSELGPLALPRLQLFLVALLQIH